MHPLDWFECIKASYLEAPIKFTSHQQEFHQAFIATSDILFKMGLPHIHLETDKELTYKNPKERKHKLKPLMVYLQ